MTNSTDDETTVRLPHTGMWVPDRGFSVTNYKELETHCGVSYTANLRRDRRFVGVIENHGTGGMTFFYPDNRVVFGEVHLEAYAARCRTAESKTVSTEWLLEQLITEAEWDRTVKRAATRKRMALRRMDASDRDMAPWVVGEWGCSIPRTEGHWTALAAQIEAVPEAQPGDGQWWQGWTGTAWRDVTTRPAFVDAGLYH